LAAFDAEKAEIAKEQEFQRRMDEAMDEEFRLAQMRRDDIDAERWDGMS
jgi:hypothetical protein